MQTLQRRLISALLVASTCAAHADIVDTLRAELPLPATAAPSSAAPWKIHTGRTLRQTIEAWSKTAAYQLVWKASHGFNIEADASFAGDFLTALEKLVTAYDVAESPLFVDVYPDQRLVVVTSVNNEVSP